MLNRHRVNRHGYFPNLCLLLLDDFHLPVREQHGQFFLGEVLILLLVNRGLVVPPDLDYAVLLQERVLEPSLEYLEAWVVVHQHPVAILGGLLCLLLVAGSLWLEPYNVVGLCKYTQELWQCTIYGLCYLACNDGGASLYLVAVGFAVVRHERVAAFLYGLGIDIAESVVYLVLYDGL